MVSIPVWGIYPPTTDANGAGTSGGSAGYSTGQYPTPDLNKPPQAYAGNSGVILYPERPIEDTNTVGTPGQISPYDSSPPLNAAGSMPTGTFPTPANYDKSKEVYSTDSINDPDKNGYIPPDSDFNAEAEKNSRQPTAIPVPPSAMDVKTVIAGQAVSIKKEGLNPVTHIMVGSIQVTTQEKITVTPQGSIQVNEKSLSLLPSQVLENKALGSVQQIQIIQENQKPVYQVDSQKAARFFGILPVSLAIRTWINADTGSIEREEKPWWSFFTN